MPEKTSDKKLADLYATFQSKDFRDDIANCIKSKGCKGMDYIPWSNVMDRFLGTALVQSMNSIPTIFNLTITE